MYGSVGLIDMPSARMAPDGELSVAGSFFKNNQRYALNFQAFPWLETSFRYSGLTHYDTRFQVYYDRSFALKARIWEEGAWMPAVAVGVNDLVGTGVFGGEYVVASKHLGEFDYTLGMGWGRLATANTIKNPFTLVAPSFAQRSNKYGQGGSFDIHEYFHGPRAGIFGGVSWQTPIRNLKLIVEYSGDSYTAESLTGNFTPRNQINFGAAYQPAGGVSLALDWLYGKSVGGTVSFQLDPTTESYPQKIGPPPLPVHPRSTDEQMQALNNLLRREQGEGRRHTAAMVDGRLVDAMWRGRPDVRDVSIRGNMLVVAVAAPSAALCQSMASIATPYAGDLSTMSLEGPGSRPMRCLLGSGRNPALQTAQWRPDTSRLPIQMAAGEPSVIDASAPPPPTPAQAIINIKRAALQQQLKIDAIEVTKSQATIYYANLQYFQEAEAVDRLLRIVMQFSPPDVESFRFVAQEYRVPVSEFHIQRSTAERAFDQNDSYDLFLDGGAPQPVPMRNPVLAAADNHSYPHFSWDAFPQLRQKFFDPVSPVGLQLLGAVSGSVEFLPGLSLFGEFDASLLDNFRASGTSDSVLPHVRTDFQQYFTKGKNGMPGLSFYYGFRLSPTVFAQARAGYLETMFAGVGGEVLWRPQGQRWALGVDAYRVQQRGFDMLFGLQPYKQTTGHVTLYYDSPWYDLNFQLRAGQYLAGDRGLTFQVTRRFSTGMEIGVFATKTNVSATQFGEGSFDKGIIIRIPLDWVLPIHTQQQFSMDLRPIQRDGGQALGGDAVLYETTRRASEAEMRTIAGQ